MNQTKLITAIEVAVDTISGFIIAMGVQTVAFPLYGMHPSHATNFQLTVIFTVFSMIRRYCIRRWFNGSLGVWLVNKLYRKK